MRTQIRWTESKTGNRIFPQYIVNTPQQHNNCTEAVLCRLDIQRAPKWYFIHIGRVQRYIHIAAHRCNVVLFQLVSARTFSMKFFNQKSAPSLLLLQSTWLNWYLRVPLVNRRWGGVPDRGKTSVNNNIFMNFWRRYPILLLELQLCDVNRQWWKLMPWDE